MRWIDFENKKPTDEFPGWTPWTEEEWKQWLSDSAGYLEEIKKLHEAGKIKERNDYIDLKSAHWGKLKPWLLALSHGKCWFSDTKDTYAHYDVEHFRPKKEAKDFKSTGRDGYWWLAFKYSNYRICGNVGNRKKGGWFPLRDGSLCSTFDRQCEESETRYLLDPIDPHDVTLLAFDEEGNAIPSPDCDEWEAERARVSIKRLNLDTHEALCEARRSVWQRMSVKIEQYLGAKARCTGCPNPAAEGDVRKYLRDILEMLRPEMELSCVARWCLLCRNDSQLLRLLN